jgi:phospholipase A1
MKPFKKIIFVLSGICFCSSVLAEPHKTNQTSAEVLDQKKIVEKVEYNVVAERVVYEENHDFNPFAITAYEPNYILPFNYSTSSTPAYLNPNPNNQSIQKIDFKFQLSLKAPIWRHFLEQKNVLYLAYTQQSFWQAYNKSAFFRANNYQPEIFLENNIDFPLVFGWNFQLLNVGTMHQSNGRGGQFERSWNRAYIEAVFSREGWLVSLRPWQILKDSAYKKYNPDMAHYLGHGRLLISYRFGQNVLSLVSYNVIDSRFRRGTIQVSYSFPLVKKIRGYIQGFNGFGQSLIEYNHRTSAIGIGISFSDWL